MSSAGRKEKSQSLERSSVLYFYSSSRRRFEEEVESHSVFFYIRTGRLTFKNDSRHPTTSVLLVSQHVSIRKKCFIPERDTSTLLAWNHWIIKKKPNNLQVDFFGLRNMMMIKDVIFGSGCFRPRSILTFEDTLLAFCRPTQLWVILHNLFLKGFFTEDSKFLSCLRHREVS